MYPVDEKISNKAANLSFVCACLVALIHFPQFPRDGAVVKLLWDVFPGSILRVAVPFFFVASGYWMAGRCDEKGWWKAAVKSRVKSLLVPYFVLNSLWFSFTVLYDSIASSHAATVTAHDIFAALGFVRGEYPALEHLWYIWRLVILVVISPLCVLVARRSKWLSIAVVGGLLVCLACRGMYLQLPREEMPAILVPFKYVVPPVGLAGFLAGVAFRIHGIPEVSKGNSLIFCVAGFALLLACKHTVNIYFSKCGFYAALPLFLFGAWGIATDRHLPNAIVRNTFAVYVFHWIIYWFLGRVDAALNLNVFFGSCIGYFSCLAIGVTGGCLIGELIHKSKLATALLLGGR